MPCEEKLVDLDLFSLKKRRLGWEELTAIFQYLQRLSRRPDQALHSGRTRDRRLQLKRYRENFFTMMTVKHQALEKVSQRGCTVCILVGFKT